MYEDFYYEPSEFDEMVDEFKESLRSAVKQEYIDKIAKLEHELAFMQDLKKNWNEKVAELERAKTEAENAKNDAIRESKKLRLSELLSDKMQIAWGITGKSEYLHKKCDKCDDQGYIHFKSPQGKELTERCCCRETKYIYSLKEASIVEFQSYNKAFNKTVNFLFRYERFKSDYYNQDEDRFKIVSDISDDKPYKKINSFSAVFLDKEKAQAYCDWLNNQGD